MLQIFFLSANFALKENETLTYLYLNTIYNQNRHHFLQLCFKKEKKSTITLYP